MKCLRHWCRHRRHNGSIQEYLEYSLNLSCLWVFLLAGKSRSVACLSKFSSLNFINLMILGNLFRKKMTCKLPSQTDPFGRKFYVNSQVAEHVLTNPYCGSKCHISADQHNTVGAPICICSAATELQSTFRLAGAGLYAALHIQTDLFFLPFVHWRVLVLSSDELPTNLTLPPKNSQWESSYMYVCMYVCLYVYIDVVFCRWTPAQAGTITSTPRCVMHLRRRCFILLTFAACLTL